jgi:hypothetical protein
MMRGMEYDPTPEEIERECEIIRRRWSDRERYCRSVGMSTRAMTRSRCADPAWRPPTVHVPLEVAEELDWDV